MSDITNSNQNSVYYSSYNMPNSGGSKPLEKIDPQEAGYLDHIRKRVAAYIENNEKFYNDNYKKNNDYYENLYNSIRTKSSGAASWRSNIFVPMIFEQVQTELPSLLDGLFGDGDAPTIQALKKGDEKQKNRAIALQLILGEHLNRTRILTAASEFLEDALKYGVGFCAVGWEYAVENVEYFDIKDGEIKQASENKVVYDGIRVVSIDPKTGYPNSGCRSREDLKVFVNHKPITREEIENLKGKAGVNDKEVERFLAEKSEEDPTTNYKLYTVRTKNFYTESVGANGANYIFKSHVNPYAGEMNVFAWNKFPIPRKIVGKGIAEVLADYNEAVNDIENLKIDNLIIGVNNIFLKKRSMTIEPFALTMAPGSVIPLDDMEGFKALKINPVSSDAFTEIEVLLGLANRVTGSVAGITTPDGLQSLNNKTATGAVILNENQSKRLDMTITYNKENALEPMIEFMLKLISLYGDPKSHEDIIGKDKMEDLGLKRKDLDYSNMDDFKFTTTGQTGSRGRMQKLNEIVTGLNVLSMIPGTAERINPELLTKDIVRLMDWQSEYLLDASDKQNQTFDQLPPEVQQQVKEFSEILNISIDQVMEMLNAGEAENLADAAAKELQNNPELAAKFSKSEMHGDVTPANTIQGA